MRIQAFEAAKIAKEEERVARESALLLDLPEADDNSLRAAVVIGGDQRALQRIESRSVGSSSPVALAAAAAPSPAPVSTPAEVAAILKLRAVVRKPVHVAGHFTSHCKEFEEVPEVHDESVCANCSITIPGREPIPEVASVRCVTCAATYCMSCAVSRLPVDKQPTVDKPPLGRLPPPVAAEPRVVRYTLPVCAPPPLPPLVHHHGCWLVGARGGGGKRIDCPEVQIRRARRQGGGRCTRTW